MRILLINQRWFQEELRAAGHEVASAGFQDNLDYCAPLPLITYEELIEHTFAGKQPDVIIIHDNSAPIWIMGLMLVEVPIIFYSVDAHHHAELHANLACVFDHVFVAQKDFIHHMTDKADAPLEWMPLWASRYVEPSEDREFETVFVGNLDKKLNPERVEFFEALEKEVPIHCTIGKWWEIFPKSNIVMNQTVKGDLNFRVFEAMITGSLLLTERSQNGLFDLFEDNVHFVTYEKNNVAEAAQKIRYFIDHPEEAQAIAKRGREEILNAHCANHRVARFVEVAESLQGKKLKSKKINLGWMYNCNVLACRMQKLDTELALRAWAYAFQAAESAVRFDEPVDEYYAYSFVNICIQFSRFHSSELSKELLAIAHEKYPNILLISFAYIRALLNHGEKELATKVAENIKAESVQTTFRDAEMVVTSFLENFEIDKSLVAIS